LGQRRENGEVCEISAREVQRALGLLERGELALDIREQIAVAAEQSRAGAADAALVDGQGHGVLQARVVCETEVVVRGEVDTVGWTERPLKLSVPNGAQAARDTRFERLRHGHAASPAAAGPGRRTAGGRHRPTGWGSSGADLRGTRNWRPRGNRAPGLQGTATSAPR